MIADGWFVMADLDLNSAIFLLSMKPKPLEIIAYHCQQSAEKYLKGFIAFHGGEIRKTHDLVVLNHDCSQYDSSFENVMEQCINLTDYGVQIRYPFHIDVEERDIKMAIEDAQTIKSLVRELTSRS